MPLSCPSPGSFGRYRWQQADKENPAAKVRVWKYSRAGHAFESVEEDGLDFLPKGKEKPRPAQEPKPWNQ